MQAKEFYKTIAQDINDEAKDNNKYIELARVAPTEKARKILLDIAAEEALHHKYLTEILNDAPTEMLSTGGAADVTG